MDYNWKAPRCLISSERGGLKVVGSTLDLLCKVKANVTVVTIAGPYRTGKSYLMNRLAGQNTGFDIGSTVQAHTKGIWAWCRPHPLDKDTCLLLLDTEGLGDPDKGDKNHDIWILTLVVLLSNILVYNNLNTISQEALLDLQLVTKISEHLQVKSMPNDDSQHFSEFFPHFVWVVRDFFLDLVIDGKPCTPDQYMEKALDLKQGNDMKTKEYNDIRRCLRHYFSLRKCFVMPRPVQNMEKMRTAEDLTDSDLDGKFLLTSDSFTQYVLGLSHCKIKTINGVAITGSALAGLCERYVMMIQEGGIPCIENAVEIISNRENSNAVEDALKVYKTEMRKLHLPTETVEEVANHHQQCEKDALAVFMKRSMFDNEQEYQIKLIKAMANEYQVICNQNEKASAANCRIMLNNLHAQISYKLQSGQYFRPGGYEIYQADMADLERKYKSSKGKGVKEAEIFSSFMEEKVPEQQSIMAADQTMTAKQKELEEEVQKVDAAVRRADVAKAEEDKLEQALRVMDRTNQENSEQLQRKLKEVNDRLTQQEEEMERKLEEKERLLREGFEEESASLHKSIRELKISIRDSKALTAAQPSDHGGPITQMVTPFAKVVTSLLDRYIFPFHSK